MAAGQQYNTMIKNNTISDSATILDALKLLNDFTVIGLTLFVTDPSNRVVGTITDGDIRRRLVGGGALTDCVTSAMNSEFSFFSSNENETVESFHKIKQRGVKVIQYSMMSRYWLELLILQNRSLYSP